ncbi:MAG: TetR family transcriptional regulator [Gammaproteobacteria bacterium]|nr:TetR family transcriptional regulator [Gammaproteobacteria bacterium]
MLKEHKFSFQEPKSRRADGAKKKIKILEAALRLIVKKGIRGVKHRAIAKEANVSLSSTTYYFKDIHDLITDAFTYFANEELKSSEQLHKNSLEALKTINKPAQLSSKEHLTAVISVFVQEHISQQIMQIDRRILEYAFQDEALHNTKLANTMTLMQESNLRMIDEFFISMGSRDPRSDAHITLASIRHIEYQLIIDKKQSIDDPIIKRMVESLIDKLLSGQV